MSESLKFTSLEAATTVYPELPWKSSAAGDVWIWDDKAEYWAPVSKGQYIVHIANRYEVKDEEPASAHPAEAPEPENDE